MSTTRTTSSATRDDERHQAQSTLLRYRWPRPKRCSEIMSSPENTGPRSGQTSKTTGVPGNPPPVCSDRPRSSVPSRGLLPTGDRPVEQQVNRSPLRRHHARSTRSHTPCLVTGCSTVAVNRPGVCARPFCFIGICRTFISCRRRIRTFTN